MNAYDLLLEWASERGQGSWRQWRDACSALAIGEPSQAARQLSALGHVEFDWVDSRFSCAIRTHCFWRNWHSGGAWLLRKLDRREHRCAALTPCQSPWENA